MILLYAKVTAAISEERVAFCRATCTLFVRSEYWIFVQLPSPRKYNPPSSSMTHAVAEFVSLVLRLLLEFRERVCRLVHSQLRFLPLLLRQLVILPYQTHYHLHFMTQNLVLLSMDCMVELPQLLHDVRSLQSTAVSCCSQLFSVIHAPFRLNLLSRPMLH